MARARRKIVLSFDGKLYPPAAVKGAVEAFAAVAPGKVAKKGGRVQVTLAPAADAPEDEILTGELGNYALGLACQLRRGT